MRKNAARSKRRARFESNAHSQSADSMINGPYTSETAIELNAENIGFVVELTD